MYKIHQDDQTPGRFRIHYVMAANLLDPLYTVENLTWGDVERFLKSTLVDQNDLTWMHDLVRLMNKQVNLTDLGNWSVL